MPHQLPFSVNQYLLPADMDPMRFLDAVAEHGFQGLGLTQRGTEVLSAQHTANALNTRNMAVTSLNSAGFFLQEGEAAARQDDANQKLLQQASKLSHTKLNVIVGGSDTVPLSEARRLATKRLQVFVQQANDLGVDLMLEPLHHLNARTKSCFNSISQLLPIFDALPTLTLNADLCHLWWDPDLDRLLRGELLPVGLLQICDVSIPENELVPRRVPLDEGFIPWRTHVHTTRTTFPDVPIELELFIDQLPHRNPLDILASSAVALTAFSEI